MVMTLKHREQCQQVAERLNAKDGSLLHPGKGICESAQWQWIKEIGDGDVIPACRGISDGALKHGPFALI